jgi:hypothetical protein
MEKIPLQIEERKRTILIEIAKLVAELENPQVNFNETKVFIGRYGSLAMRFPKETEGNPFGVFTVDIKKYVTFSYFGYDPENNILVIRDPVNRG